MRTMLLTSLLVSLGAAAQADAQTLRVLILSGRNNHDWQTTTPFLKAMYEASGRFSADVTDDPASLTAETLASYDVLVDNWSAYPDMTGRQWDAAEEPILDFVRGGKGFVLLHAATACFSDWPEFQQMAGCTWGDESGHGTFHPFRVFIDDPEHPIAQGMPQFLTGPDELYHKLTPHPSMHVVASAFSAKDQKGTGDFEPVAVTTQFGEGRCFYNILGHNVEAMSGAGFRTLMLRGTEWAATGAVTIPVPEDLPTPKVNGAVVVGGHSFDEAVFPQIFDAHEGASYEILEQKDDSEIFDNVENFPYNVVVLYNMGQKITEARQANLLKLLDQGVGLVVLHHAVAAFNQWPEYANIIGAKYYLEDTADHTKSVYLHDVDFTVNVADPNHPVTRGLQEFVIHDETYNNYDIFDDNRVLLTTTETSSAPSLCWVRRYGNANVCFIQLGHGPEAFANPDYQRLVAQAATWAAKQK
ncbi:MAG: ThuA domain-containing protein [Candidatus Hydrogenedentes bacterium]|nr:ThuA domain-containing protein [Candidatus Hydrogenedentota bacterium]